MLLPDDFDDRSWRALMTRLDEQIEQATRTYVTMYSLRDDDIAVGFSELAKLREGIEPDYGAVGLPVAYALRYLPFRTATLLASLTLVANCRVPRRVLDIGSGMDAGSLALGLWATDSPIEVVTVEPSEAMSNFAALLDVGSNSLRRPIPGTFADLVTGALGFAEMSFDLIIMSACLPYSDLDWDSLTEAIGRLTREPSAIIAVEPERKAAKLDRLRTGFSGTGWFRCHIFCCHELVESLTSPRILLRLNTFQSERFNDILASGRLSRRGGRMLGDNPDFGRPFDVLSWNDDPRHRDKVLLCLEGFVEGDIIAL
jgi:SAM-dependent methyltransferase